jgi:hypothetical protein
MERKTAVHTLSDEAVKRLDDIVRELELLNNEESLEVENREVYWKGKYPFADVVKGIRITLRVMRRDKPKEPILYCIEQVASQFPDLTPDDFVIALATAFRADNADPDDADDLGTGTETRRTAD